MLLKGGKQKLIFVCWRDLRRVVRSNLLKVGQIFDVFVVEPLDFEMQIHVVSALALAMLLVFYKNKHVKEMLRHTLSLFDHN